METENSVSPTPTVLFLVFLSGGHSMRSSLAIAFLFAMPALARAAEPEYDLLIRGGRIVDGTGNPWFQGDIAIAGDKIVAVGHVPEGKAKRVIEAKGLVVAPGFIDMHSHSDDLLLEDGHAQSKIRQGVTTEVLGEGRSAGPLKGRLPPRRFKARGKEIAWSTLGEYLDTAEKAGVSVNVASYVGLDNVWEAVMGQSHERPTSRQLDEMKVLLDEAMRDGAFGMSTMLAMPPGSLATTDDLVELCAVVKKHGGLFSSHIRNEGLGVFDAVKEAIAVGERAGVPVDIIHVKIADEKYWGRMTDVIALIEEARSRGVNVQSNVYPYTRGNNNLASIIPPWAHEGGVGKMLERLKNPKDRERLKKDIQQGIEGWYNHYTAVGGDWSRMLVSGRGQYEGLTMDRIIAVKSKGKTPPRDPLDVLFDILIEERGSVPTVYAHHDEKDMNLALSQSWCSIGSDGSAYATDGALRRGNPHPRNFGTFPRVLGVYVRDRGVLKLEDAVRKMTSLNAAKLGIRDRGQLRLGDFADVTVFDPASVIDKSTYTAPFAYNEGIEYVIVNGKVVLDRDKHTGEMPGRALRRK
jgi:N-acyl-D-aspartate/D-glutamate deacylase